MRKLASKIRYGKAFRRGAGSVLNVYSPRMSVQSRKIATRSDFVALTGDMQTVAGDLNIVVKQVVGKYRDRLVGNE